MKSTITLKVEKNDKERIELLFKDRSIAFDSIEMEKFDGMSETVQIILAISATTIPVIGKIIIELIKSNKQVSVKYKDFELSGIEENKALDFLNKVLKIEEGKTDE